MKLGNQGNPLWQHTNFNDKLQPTEIGVGDGSTSTSMLGLTYGYGTTNNNGNVLSQIITVPGPLTRTQSYTYDGHNRLASVTEADPNSWSQTYNYCDQYGNGCQYGNRRVSGSIPYPQLTPSDFSASTNQIVDAGWDYDDSGNLTVDGLGRTFSYDLENRQITFNGTAATYSYDGEGRRVKKVDGSGTAIYVYDAMGRLAAEYSTQTLPSSGTTFMTADHLGSIRLTTDASGNVVSRHDYLPFGEEIPASWGGRSAVTSYGNSDVPQRFTGKERDAESGLDYFGARYFSGAQGRFTSPDDIKYGRINDPQTWNLYTYSRNGPLTRIDIDGHNWFEIGGQWEWHEGDNYFDEKRMKSPMRSDYTHMLVARSSGIDKKTGANKYTLTLYDQNEVEATGTAFSGGNGHPALANGNYFILTAHHASPTTINPDSELKNPPQDWAMQKILDRSLKDPSPGGSWYDVYAAYGPIRARLNPLDPGMIDAGAYFHGQDPRVGSERAGSTHGCLSYGQDLKIIQQLWNLPSQRVPVSINTKATP